MSTNRIPEVFLSEIFGVVRIIMEDNKFYFCAMDVCKALGYTNITRELNIHCRQDGIRTGRVESNGVPRIVKFVSEGNVYRLICRSTKPEAEQFETWVFDELLPTIRQTGGYVNDPVVFVDLHRAVSASVNSVDFGEFAKCLANDHIDIGRNRLMAWLRKEKYIDAANIAYQRYIQQGIFDVKETVYYIGRTPRTARKTLITPKGQVYLAKKVAEGYKG